MKIESLDEKTTTLAFVSSSHYWQKVATDIFYKGEDISESNMLLTTKDGGKATRDEVFYEVLKMFNEEPIKIFQVGAMESFDCAFRYGSGWSDVFFANYIKKHGVELTVCDPSLDHLANSIASASLLDYRVETMFARAEDFMRPEYDLYYLDGSNDPEECSKQMDIIKDSSCVVLCDDFYIKAALIKDKFDWQIRPVANTMGILDLRN